MNKNVIKNIVKLIIIFTAFLCSSLFKLIPVYLFNINVKNMSNTTYTLLTLFSDICILIIGLVLYGKELIKEWKAFKKKPGENFDIAFKYYFIGLAIMIGSNIIINFILKLGNSQNEQAVQGLITTNPWLMLLFAGLFAPIIEELVFRKSLKNVLKNKYLFIFISGFVFGLLHIIGYNLKTPLELLYIIPYGTLGVMFALMDYKINSTYPSIFMHMFHNTALTLLSIFSNMF
ncbi:MAG: CPBP family intramembrane metalloprotease [Bacilli bacterium]|nr:CPBP family intramembrane metalloprotease [Bacilli bacterium]